MKKFGKVKKMAAALILTVMVAGVAGSGAATAASDHLPGCARLSKTISCTGPMYSHLAGAHEVVVTSTGITVICEVTEKYGQHDIYCSNPACRVHLSTETRVCAAYHTCYKCKSGTGLCQYQ